MSIVWTVLGWLFTAVFGLLIVSMLLLHNWLHAFVLLLVLLLVLPPVSSLLKTRFDLTIHPLLRGVVIFVLLFVFVRLLTGEEATSIYASPEVKAQFLAIYDAKMAEWPVPYEDIFLDTEYGVVHVIASGPEDAPPMLLLHASGVSGWSWKFNVADFSQDYRTYAIDLIGDAGKSEFANLTHILKTRQDQADLYADICDKLGLEKVYVVGASEGGFIGSNFALYYPERVEKLALLGPMGYAGATETVTRIMLTQFFPLKQVQESMLHWAFGDGPELNEEVGEWFRLFVTQTVPQKVAPLPLPAAQRQSLSLPVLFVFGKGDNLVGDPEAARALVQDMPDVRVAVVDAGHLMGAEAPELVNELVLNFFATD